MHYMEVIVASAAYHGGEPLTYSSELAVEQGSVVEVPLRSDTVLGVVVKNVLKPSFKVKSIIRKAETPLLPAASLALMRWIKEYYPSPLGIIAQLFLPRSLPKKSVDPLSIATSKDHPLPPLTQEQKIAVETIREPKTYLLHGDTGTGKTRVYLELAKQSIAKGRSVIILTPEIGLTSQLEQDFSKTFRDRVIVIHSQLTEVTRQRIWLSILREQEPLILVGPRSALFMPLKKIGLIVIDEAHETAYKQDQAPYYHASRVAAKLSTFHGAPLVLGTATPLVGDYFVARTKGLPIIRMKQTAVDSTAQKSISVVDLRDRSKFTKKSYLSDELIKAAADNLARGEQTLLFLNRRGTARVIFCEQCSWQALCPHCDLPLVYHGDTHTMRCHSCNYSAQSPVSCPNCHNATIVFKSIGTKAIVDEVERLLPDARVMRFDTDNKKHERIEQHYDAIKKGEVDILVGTQTLAKGLDLPQLSLVGVVMADASLYFPDFSAQERTYQLLAQVFGRVGRGHRDSRIIVQTYSPKSPLLSSVIQKDWETFYENEIAERKQFLFPPFCYLLTLTCRRASLASVQKASETFAQKLRSSNLKIQVEGPAPAFHEKLQNKYQWQLVIKAKQRGELLRVISQLPSGWSYDIDPLNLL